MTMSHKVYTWWLLLCCIYKNRLSAQGNAIKVAIIGLSKKSGSALTQIGHNVTDRHRETIFGIV